MVESRIAWFAPLAGIVFVVLAIASFAIEGGTPSTKDSPTQVVEFYEDNDAQVKVASAVAVLAGASAVLFAVRVGGAMRGRSESGLLATTTVAGGVIAAAGIAVDAGIRWALADTAGEITPEATQALFGLWDSFFWPIHAGVAILVIAASLGALDTKLFPVWLSGLGILAGVLAFIPIVAVLFTGLLGLALWVVIASVLLFRQPLAEPARASQ